MAIQETDLSYRYSNPAASGGSQLSQSNPEASLGGFVAMTVWPGGSLNDLFDDETSAENQGLVRDYRCVFVVNGHPTLPWLAPVVWLTSTTPGGCQIAVGVDPTAPSAVNATTPQAVTTADAHTAPAGVTFGAPTTKAAGLALPTIPPGNCQAIWVRRIAPNSPTTIPDGFGIRVEGDTN